ncbi:hypothetical protein GY45DRAFT_1434491 [Cubamyces sp. BRFM 1775]|nr:hypothetical protein GY45DRAFT_1434491 [Cubamyces sp. BRFM 1775]
MPRMQHQSAAQHGLLISEIVGEICEVLYTNGQLKALARLSQTSKPLHEAVVPVLWRHIEGLKPLLKLLPQDIWAEIQSPDGLTTFHITNPDALDWTRYKHYAPFIRSLRWLSSDTISPEALAAVSLHSPYGNALLPYLSKLTWVDSRDYCMAFARIFLAPSIRELDLTVPDDHAPVATAAFFKHARQVCREVEVLKLNSRCYTSTAQCVRFPHEEDVSLSLANWLRVLTNLREFVGHPYISARCVWALGALPNLLAVELKISQRQVDAIAAPLTSPSATGRSWFKSVVKLNLCFKQLNGSSQVFLAAVQSTTLRRLLLHVDSQLDPAVVKTHMQACASAAYQHSLCSVGFYVPLGDIRHPSPALPIKTILGPLFALRQITNVVVLVPHFNLDGDTLRAMSEAWPALKTLNILRSYCQSERSEWNSQYVALRDLVHLARNCPGLQGFGLHVDATDAPTADDAEMQRLLPVPSRCKLFFMKLPHAPIEDPVSVGRFLSRLFPELRMIAGCSGRPMIGAWEKVTQVLSEESRAQVPTRQVEGAV